MHKRRPNHRLVKIHRSYTVEEAARVFGIHKNTVRAWIDAGLPVCKDMRPHLILGRELAAFLQARRAKKKRPCAPGEMYCFRCRVPRTPAGGWLISSRRQMFWGLLWAYAPSAQR
jgi:hypothetical protein